MPITGQSARKHGPTPDRRKWRIVTFAHVAETRERARADVKYGLDNFRRYFTEAGTITVVPPDIAGDSAEYLNSSGLACIGTPDDCIRHSERLWRSSNGGFGGVLLLAHNWADWAATRKSYELMACYVHPHSARCQWHAALELRRRARQIRHRRRAFPRCRPGSDRPASVAHR